MPAEMQIDPGTRYGRLTVVSATGEKINRSRYFSLKCDCGGQAKVSLRNLRAGLVRSCGCIKRERAIRLGRARATHGESTYRTPEYQSWRSMKERCLNPNKDNYPRYGGAGVKICPEWISFETFLSDMGRKPTLAHTLDRIDSAGDYEPSNCRWSTPKEQANNRRYRSSCSLQMEA